MGTVGQAVIVGVLAGFVGLTELVGRYRSDPAYALTHSVAAWFYVAINAAAGVGALLLIITFDWKFGLTEHIDVWRILIAGFGAIAFFRSSLFVAKIGGSDVGVGPSLVLGTLLEACDRQVDRKSAEKMSAMMKEKPLLAGLDPNKVMQALPVLCLALMQNFSSGDQAQLAADLSKLISGDDALSPHARMRAVIVHLSKYLGTGVISKVLNNAREVFVETAPAPATSLIEHEALIEQTKKEMSEAEIPPPTTTP